MAQGQPYYNAPAADRYANVHLNLQTPQLNTILAEARQNCRCQGIPEWTAIDSQGKFLMLQCRMLGVRHMLEIGTLGGQSAIWCASGNPDLHVTTIEIKSRFAAVARENVRNAGLEDRVEVVEGRAQDVIPQLTRDIVSGEREKFGLVLVDVETFGDTWEIVNQVVEFCLDRACLMVHCALRPSNLSLPTAEEKEDRVRGTRELVERVGQDERLDAVVLMTDGEEQYDTLVAAVQAR